MLIPSAGRDHGLVERFLERCGTGAKSPSDAIEDCVERLRIAVGGSGRGILDNYFMARGVQHRTVVTNLGADGAISPLGSKFEDGFRVELNHGLSGVRQRFTEAHELCHTFFYEYVPEIKFRPHMRDPLEEQLCNRGAAALLIPGQRLREQVGDRTPSLTSLIDLARDWGVALETMFLRLRHLKLWDCQLSIWRRGTGGGYLAIHAYGWGKGEWNWVDEEGLEKVWGRGGVSEGRTFVYREDASGHSFARPIHYEIARHGSAVVALSSYRAPRHPASTMTSDLFPSPRIVAAELREERGHRTGATRKSR